MKKYYAVQKFEKSADVYIFGDIVVYECFEGDVSAAGFVEEINKLDVEEINVHIDCYGGAVSEGWAIYNALRNHPAKINTYGDGFVASAALYPFLAGDNRYASSVSGYYLHQVLSGAFGYAEDLRCAADEAETLTEIGINAFVERAGMNAEEVKKLMENETWLTPAQALELGIATAILADKSFKYSQESKKNIFKNLFEKSTVNQKEEKPKEPEQKTEPVNQPNGIMQMLSGFFNLKEEEK